MTRALIRAAVAEAIGELTGYSPENIHDSANLLNDLGVDSMVAMRLIVAVEDRVQSKLPDGWEGSMVGVQTIAELVDCLAMALVA